MFQSATGRRDVRLVERGTKTNDGNISETRFLQDDNRIMKRSISPTRSTVEEEPF